MQDLETAKLIVSRLQTEGFEAYFAGGCVRDLLLGRTPKDYDIATSARPEAIQTLFGSSAIAIGAAFGVIAIKKGGDLYEIATFRSDGEYTDGRHPDAVRFTTAQKDAERRDFTINALFMDPMCKEIEPDIIDYVSGRNDLRNELIRAVGDPEQRFNEDYLRMLRAIRFASQLGFTIESETFMAIRSNASNILRVSWERIREEVTKMLLSPDPAVAIHRMKSTGLLKYILPEVDCLDLFEQPKEFHPEGNAYKHTIECLKYLPRDPEPELAWAALLHDVGKSKTQGFKEDGTPTYYEHDKVGADMVEVICDRFKFSTAQKTLITQLVLRHMKFRYVKEMKLSKLKKFLRIPRFDLHLALHKCDCFGSHKDLELYDYCIQRREELAEEIGGDIEKALRPKPLINGHDLIELGLKPGPEFRVLLGMVENYQLDGYLTTKEEALRFLDLEISKGIEP